MCYQVYLKVAGFNKAAEVKQIKDIINTSRNAYLMTPKVALTKVASPKESPTTRSSKQKDLVAGSDDSTSSSSSKKKRSVKPAAKKRKHSNTPPPPPQLKPLPQHPLCTFGVWPQFTPTTPSEFTGELIKYHVAGQPRVDFKSNEPANQVLVFEKGSLQNDGNCTVKVAATAEVLARSGVNIPMGNYTSMPIIKDSASALRTRPLAFVVPQVGSQLTHSLRDDIAIA